jgi:hypothetical protein
MQTEPGENSMKKVYRAICAGSCEKRWIGDQAIMPAGWFESAKEALSEWAEPQPTPADASIAVRNRRIVQTRAGE